MNAGPGEHARYRDRDIFTLSTGIESLYREKEDEDAVLWQMMVDVPLEQMTIIADKIRPFDDHARQPQR